ncbi:glutamate ABC transporter substrate-binding protein [Wenjunlia tyrosinilytica]|uniref:Sugar-binding protein n=1 Tax=Wenjunlia tyrosinilytica TaxID=1544741 RepID=A0A917ZFE0_9ACTN|nr:glutamate ABC transporter substrate-binding protein [Wenjunlia tyrosinilytica]GGO81019.1 sugar-binding protein [Wenjunlia tyrosinilytica]
MRSTVVGALAACAVGLGAFALPLVTGGTGSGEGTGHGASSSAAKSASARQAAAGTCDPTASLRPSGGSEGSGPGVDRIKKRGKLVVGVDQNSYLWGYRDPGTGRIEGFDIDLVRAIANDILGSPDKVTYKTVPTDQRIPAIRNGTVDMVVRTMTITCERLDQVAFSTVYFEAGQQLLAPKDSAVTGFDDSLSGKRVCVAKGSTNEALLAKDSHGSKAVLVPNQLDCLVRVQLGEADAVLTDNALAAGQAAQDPSMHLVGKKLTDEPYGVAMKKGDDGLVRRVNKVLEDYRSGGGRSPWMRSFDKWLGHDLDKPSAPPSAKYKD